MSETATDDTRLIQAVVRDEVERLERVRCRALVANDLETLGALMTDDLVHVHATGKTDDKAAYLGMVADQVRFLEASRTDYAVRVYGEVAIATGPLNQRIEFVSSGKQLDMHVMTTQVWVRRGETWSQSSFQATNL